MKRILSLPDAKSILIRNLVIHYVKTGEVLAISEDSSSDVCITRAALLVVRDALKDCDTHSLVRVDVRDCGAAYRILMALLATTPGAWLLTGVPRLLERPVGELVDTLSRVGASIKQTEDGWRIQGRHLQAEELIIDCTRSSQYATALLIAAPLLGLKTLLVLPQPVASAPYINLTRNMLDYEVEMPGMPFSRQSVGRLGDWSAAIYGYALAMLHSGESYELEDLSLQSAQGDAVVAEWFRDMGVTSRETDRGVEIVAVQPGQSLSRTFPVAAHPDLVPVMAALACLLPAEFRFEGIGNLRYKESDRIGELSRQLAPFADIEIEGEEMRVTGRPRRQWPKPPYRFFTVGDHRLAMAFLLFGDEARIDDTACLAKSWPALSHSVL